MQTCRERAESLNRPLTIEDIEDMRHACMKLYSCEDPEACEDRR